MTAYRKGKGRTRQFTFHPASLPTAPRWWHDAEFAGRIGQTTLPPGYEASGTGAYAFIETPGGRRLIADGATVYLNRRNRLSASAFVRDTAAGARP